MVTPLTRRGFIAGLVAAPVVAPAVAGLGKPLASGGIVQPRKAYIVGDRWPDIHPATLRWARALDASTEKFKIAIRARNEHDDAPARPAAGGEQPSAGAPS